MWSESVEFWFYFIILVSFRCDRDKMFVLMRHCFAYSSYTMKMKFQSESISKNRIIYINVAVFTIFTVTDYFGAKKKKKKSF